MTDERGPSGQGDQGGSEGRHAQPGDADPWAPPEKKVSLGKPEAPAPAYVPPPAPMPHPSAPYGHPGPPQHPGYAYPGPGGMPGAPWLGGPQLPTGTSTASMVLGIIGLVLTLTCYGSVLGIFVAPVALGLGISARRKVAAGLQGGSGQANAGFVMGIVGTVLSVLIAAFLVFALVAAVNAEHDGPYGDDPYGSDPYGFDARGPVPALVVPDGVSA